MKFIKINNDLVSLEDVRFIQKIENYFKSFDIIYTNGDIYTVNIESTDLSEEESLSLLNRMRDKIIQVLTKDINVESIGKI